MGFDMKYGTVSFKEENNIGDLEPVFVIRGQDSLALQTIRDYIGNYEDVKGGEKGSAAFLSELYYALSEFEAWQAINKTKIPD